VAPSVDLNTLDARIKIRNSIHNGEIDSAVALINQLHPELLDNDNFLHFHLQVSHLYGVLKSDLLPN